MVQPPLVMGWMEQKKRANEINGDSCIPLQGTSGSQEGTSISLLCPQRMVSAAQRWSCSFWTHWAHVPKCLIREPGLFWSLSHRKGHHPLRELFLSYIPAAGFPYNRQV